MSEFAKIFRKSKFTSYEPLIKQVYSSIPSNSRKGDWGTKINIPLGWKSPYISITAIQSTEKLTTFDSALNRYLNLKRFRKNFGNNEAWIGLSESPIIYLVDLNHLQFQELLTKIRKKRKEWSKINNNENFDIKKVLNISSGLDFNKKVAPSSYKIDRISKSEVKGRALIITTSKILVGVNGTICEFIAPPSYLRTYNMQPYILQKFCVQSVNFLESGRFKINLRTIDIKNDNDNGFSTEILPTLSLKKFDGSSSYKKKKLNLPNVKALY